MGGVHKDTALPIMIVNYHTQDVKCIQNTSRKTWSQQTNDCHKHKWEHITTKMELKLYGVTGVDWIHPAQDRGQRRGLFRSEMR